MYILALKKITLHLYIVDTSLQWTLFNSPNGVHYREVSLYVNGYQNSLRNINLGSIYVNDVYDCVRDNRIYPERLINNGQTFITAPGFLSTPEALNPGASTIRVNVTKPNISSAWSIINLDVESIDSEYVRQAATIRIQGKLNLHLYQNFLIFFLQANIPKH